MHQKTSTPSSAETADHEITWWWKPHNDTVEAEIAYVLQHAGLITEVILYCEFAVRPNGTFGLWTEPTWRDFGDNALCPAVIDTMHRAGIATQVIVSLGNMSASAYKLAFAHADAFAHAMLAVSEDAHYKSIRGWNFDFEGNSSIDAYVQDPR